ncbi:UDP-N-acetylglucosamine 2-epimerase [Desulfovibrio mangrovi]|uniref:UDP-N-acetylglucosamine 2-epimerase n=1 Tax=Desulfovibrio mangrovi TaxID=2976983 RepID=UPI002248154B|nr:UDP-N-acetylglucosamine 2-epimerase [Desulfovibrio mangrovi]UZP66883.1 UDP-N-acetylglucosamine 2-epimerase [Desulfovibrio mangrovi]
MAKKKLLFITGTRADFGKLCSLIDKVSEHDQFEYCIFITGMHTLSRYGYTVDEVMKKYDSFRLEGGFRNVHVYMNQVHGESMDMVLGNTIFGLSRYVSQYQPDMIVVHGDRVEALAGSIVGSLRNILVAHIEGGELSGTIDELIRHAVSKLAHLHFVANGESRKRLMQMGESSEAIYSIGSPDVDLMLSADLPAKEQALAHYNIPFEEYAITLLHPVTTDGDQTKRIARHVVDAMLQSKDNYIVIYPNNDHGSDIILDEYERLKNNPRIVIYPSLRIDYFLVLLRDAQYLLGNSSAGIRETPVYGVPSVNIGSRQDGRFSCSSIVNVDGDSEAILQAIGKARDMVPHKPRFDFGKGNSAEKFINILMDENIWLTKPQKQFVDHQFNLCQ